jgi:outer membrane protein assembly factor BamB/tetratricopeptide (TPR) repeat protein
MRRLAWLLVVLPVVAGGTGAPGTADDTETPFPFMVRDTNAARFAVEEAKARLAEGATNAALDAVQRVVEEFPDELYRVERKAESARWVPAAEVARDLLAALPAEARARYTSRVGAATRPLLERAVLERDPALLRRLLLTYGAAADGHTAGASLARIHLEAGRVREAAWAAREALRYTPSDAGLWVVLADALQAMGEGGAAALASTRPPEGLRTLVGGVEVSADARWDAARRATTGAALATETPMWGARPDRAGRYAAAPPFPTPRHWRNRVAISRRSQDEEQEFIRGPDSHRRFDALWMTYRPLHPVVRERVVYVEDGISVRAFDLYSGRSVWTFDAESKSPLALFPPGWLAGRTSFDRAFSPVLVGGTGASGAAAHGAGMQGTGTHAAGTYGTVLATVEVERPYSPESLQQVEISSYQPRRVLVALDAADGSLRWSMGASGADRLLLAETTVVSPPVVVGNLALVLGANLTGLQNLAFLAFEVDSGRLAWRRSLGAGQQELNLFGIPVKELASSPPAVADGIAYAWTGLGFAVAVEVTAGRPVWLASYEIQPLEPVQFWFRAPLRFPRTMAGPPVVHGDVVVMAPPDSDHLHAFDRKTGRLLWRREHEPLSETRGAVTTLLGVVHDGVRDVVLLAGASLVALDLANGTLRWQGRYEHERDFPLGQGFVAKDQVVVPTVRGVQRFSIPGQGRLVAFEPWPADAEPGNLVPADQVLVVASRDSVQAFYSWEEIERDLARRRRERPGDPLLLLEAGEVYRQGGQLDAARRMYEEALRLAGPDAPAGQRARQGLYLAHVAEGDLARERSPERAAAAYQAALPWADANEQKVEVRLRLDRLLPASARERNLQALVAEAGTALGIFDPDEGPVPARAAALLRLARLRLEAGRPAEAVDLFQRVLAEEGRAAFPEGPARRRARAGIDEVLARSGRTPYARHEAAARELLARASAGEEAALLERILEEYPNAEVVPQALLDLGARRLERDPRGAATLLRGFLREHGANLRATEALARLSLAYERGGQRGARRLVLERLATRDAATPFTLDGTEWTGASFAQAAARRASVSLPPDQPPAGHEELRTPLVLSDEEPPEDEPLARPVGVKADPREPAPVALLASGDGLTAIDLDRSKVLFRTTSGPVTHAAYAAGVLVIAPSGTLKGLDVSPQRAGQVRWEMKVPGFAYGFEAWGGVVFVLVREGAAAASGRRLLCLDPATGDVLWETALGVTEVQRRFVVDGDPVLEEPRFDGPEPRVTLRVYDGVTGSTRREIPLPSGKVERDTLVIDGAIVLHVRPAPSGNDPARTLVAIDVGSGTVRWRVPLEGKTPVSALLEDRGRVVLHLFDGRISTFDARTGERLEMTRLYAGETARPFPSPPSAIFVDGERIVFAPALGPGERSARVAAFERSTGRLVWESRFPPLRRPGRVVLQPHGASLVAALVPSDPAEPTTVRILEAADGTLLQEIDPGPVGRDTFATVLASRGTVVVYGRHGAAVYGAPPDAKEAVRPAR